MWKCVAYVEMSRVLDTRTGAKTTLSLADDEFACSIENEDADSDFGVHFMYKVRVFGVFGGEEVV
jgi:hypothetical protein